MSFRVAQCSVLRVPAHAAGRVTRARQTGSSQASQAANGCAPGATVFRSSKFFEKNKLLEI